MRLFLVMLALAFGATPAVAQWQLNPGPVKPADKPVQHHHHAPLNQHHHHAPLKKSVPRAQTHRAATAIPAKKVPLPRHVPRKAADVVKKVPLPVRPPERTGAEQQSAKAASAKADASGSEAFAGIPPEQRLKIRSALYWHGDYSNGDSDDDPAEAAIKSFQKRNKLKVTGVLTEDQRKELIEADERYQREYGWRVMVDPATGIRIGLPTRLVPDVYDAPRGTRWSSPNGAVQVETFRIKGAEANLAKLFEDAKKHPAGRRVETSALHDDGFFVSGTQGLKDFAVRAKLRDGEVRGFTILYDQMMETIVEPVMVAMASAFSPFPQKPMPFAALSRRVEYGTGLIVSADGAIVTASRVVRGCEVIVADGLGNAERVAEEDGGGLALLRVYGAAKLTPMSLAGSAATAGDIKLVGYPDPKEENGRKELITFQARLVDANSILPRQPVPMAGFSGAAAVDGKGQFLGIMETRNYVLASTKPAVPPLRLVRAGIIRDFLARHHVAVSNSSTADARAAAVRVICVRK